MCLPGHKRYERLPGCPCCTRVHGRVYCLLDELMVEEGDREATQAAGRLFGVTAACKFTQDARDGLLGVLVVEASA